MEAGLKWFRVAVVYFAVAVLIGLWMGGTTNLALYSVHSHANLLGWVSAALTGAIYQHCQGAARSRLAAAHFWLYNLALPVMLAGLAARGLGSPSAEPVVAAGSLAVTVAVLLFASNILLHVRSQQ